MRVHEDLLKLKVGDEKLLRILYWTYGPQV